MPIVKPVNKIDSLPVGKLAVNGGKPVASKMILFGEPKIGEEEIQEVVATLKSGWIGTGPKTKEFEKRFAAYIGAPYAVAVSSCTAALHLSLFVSRIGPGDEVITTPLTFTATVNAIMHVGATPIFVDVDPETFNLDLEQIEEKITSKTKAILPVHFGGLPNNLDQLSALARKYELTIIEDAAHAVGGVYHGAKIGSFGNLTCFSFYANKNLTTVEGGMITLADAELKTELEMLRLHGMEMDAWKRYKVSQLVHSRVIYPGFKYNLTDFQSSLGLHQLKKLETFLTVRERYAAMYDEAFQELFGLKFQFRPTDYSHNRHALHLYTVLLDLENLTATRDEFVYALRMENVGAAIHYTALHLEPFYQKTFNLGAGKLPVAEWISERTLSLPLSPALSENDIQNVIKAVKKVYSYYRK